MADSRRRWRTEKKTGEDVNYNINKDSQNKFSGYKVKKDESSSRNYKKKLKRAFALRRTPTCGSGSMSTRTV